MRLMWPRIAILCLRLDILRFYHYLKTLWIVSSRVSMKLGNERVSCYANALIISLLASPALVSYSIIPLKYGISCRSFD